jgi:pimeloyl-ACP methyl ester carboxylesterase
MTEVVPIERAFLRTPDGLIHYRHTAPPGGSRKTPLVLAHGGPGSSAGLAPLIAELGADRLVVAPDMMGNGDSDPPPGPTSIAFYADGVAAVLDHLGLETVDLYGHHTGAQVITEFAIARSNRARRLVLDGIALFPPELRAEFLQRYAPPITPDAEGRHLAWVWDFLTETTRHFPHYRTDAEHRIEGGAALPPGLLTDRAAEVLKTWRTYHMAYLAAFQHEVAARLPLLSAPTLILAVDRDPLAPYAPEAAALIAGSTVAANQREQRGAMIRAFLDDATE